MMFWRNIFDVKDGGLSLLSASDLARRAGYPLFNYMGTIYKFVTDPGNEQVFTAEATDTKAEDLTDPDVFCVLNQERMQIATNQFGPALFADPAAAGILANKIGGVVDLYFLALRELRKKKPGLIEKVEKPKIILPGDRHFK